MKVLLTGATGYLGRHLTEALTAMDHELILLVRSADKLSPLLQNVVVPVTVIRIDDKDWKEKLRAASPDGVIHLAAFLSSADDAATIDQLIDANIRFGTHLLDALKGRPLRFFINTGSFAEYNGNDVKMPEPAYLYAATKTAFRPILQYYQRLMGFRLLHVIPYTIYGRSGDAKKLIDYIYEALDAAVPVNMSPGEQVLDLIHIDDVIRFYLQLLKHPDALTGSTGVFHLGTGTGTSPRQLCGILEKATGKKANINWGGRPYRDLDTMYAVAPPDSLAGRIGWKAEISIEQGIQQDYNTIKRGI